MVIVHIHARMLYVLYTPLKLSCKLQLYLWHVVCTSMCAC